MRYVGVVYSKILDETLPVYEYNGRLVPCICDPDTVCYMHIQQKPEPNKEKHT